MAQDVYVIFSDDVESPADFVDREIDMIEVTWDEPDYRGGYEIEGSERVVDEILTKATAQGKIRVLQQFL